jgi:hypothetical protein
MIDIDVILVRVPGFMTTSIEDTIPGSRTHETRSQALTLSK